MCPGQLCRMNKYTIQSHRLSQDHQLFQLQVPRVHSDQSCLWRLPHDGSWVPIADFQVAVIHRTIRSNWNGQFDPVQDSQRSLSIVQSAETEYNILILSRTARALRTSRCSCSTGQYMKTSTRYFLQFQMVQTFVCKFFDNNPETIHLKGGSWEEKEWTERTSAHSDKVVCLLLIISHVLGALKVAHLRIHEQSISPYRF